MTDQPTERVTVMIVDDQPPFRAAARAVIDRVAGFELVAEVASGEEAVETSSTVAPQLVVRQILETPERHESLREWLAEEFRKDSGVRDATAQAIFVDSAAFVPVPLAHLVGAAVGMITAWLPARTRIPTLTRASV